VKKDKISGLGIYIMLNSRDERNKIIIKKNKRKDMGEGEIKEGIN
jgi:hypothetical protein